MWYNGGDCGLHERHSKVGQCKCVNIGVFRYSFGDVSTIMHGYSLFGARSAFNETLKCRV